jgi:hypothetical protein
MRRGRPGLPGGRADGAASSPELKAPPTPRPPGRTEHPERSNVITGNGPEDTAPGIFRPAPAPHGASAVRGRPNIQAMSMESR